MDVAESRRDHYPVVVSWNATFNYEGFLVTHRKPIVSRDSTKSFEAVELFRNAARQMPVQIWNTQVHDRHGHVIGNIQDAAKAAVPLDSTIPKKDWLSQTTWDQILCKNQIHRTLKWLTTSVILLFTKFSFKAWRMAAGCEIDLYFQEVRVNARVLLTNVAYFHFSLMHASNLTRKLTKTDGNERIKEVACITTKAALKGENKSSHAGVSY